MKLFNQNNQLGQQTNSFNFPKGLENDLKESKAFKVKSSDLNNFTIIIPCITFKDVKKSITNIRKVYNKTKNANRSVIMSAKVPNHPGRPSSTELAPSSKPLL